MNLQQLNDKYYGRPVDLRAWSHPVFGLPPNMGFSVEAQFSDGRYYNLRATLVLDAMRLPHEMRKGKAVFAELTNVQVLDAWEKIVPDGGDKFADDIETLIGPLVGLPEVKGKCIYAKNNVCPWDITEVIRRHGSRAELDAAWEKVKRELVHYIACKFDLPEPQDLSEEKEDMEAVAQRIRGRLPLTLTELRVRMEHTVCSSATPSWTRSQSWVDLRNEMLDEMFDRVGVVLPPHAHELMYMFNGRKPPVWTRVLSRNRRTHELQRASIEKAVREASSCEKPNLL